MASCSICLDETSESNGYHRKCLQTLFGSATLPSLELELSQLYSLAATKMAGKMSISGAQEKVSLALSTDRSKLEVVAKGGRYILKPETSRFSSIPQNEQLTMQLSSLVGIETPSLGLIGLTDHSTAYIIKRFDRLDDGGKLQVEDFCQLAGKRMRDKYDGSAELCVKILRQYASEPLIEIQKLYRLLLFCWWTENGDMHLKNFSLITDEAGIRRMSPAYDLVCTKLVIPDDTLAMPIGGRRSKLRRSRWLDFAAYCGLPRPAAERLVTRQIEALEPALKLVWNSFLSKDMKDRYAEFLQTNTKLLEDDV